MLDHIKDLWRRAALGERGITTSEFWLTGVTIVSTVAGLDMKKAIILSVVVGAYTISRGLTKKQ